ncbi:MAG: hypothetical protein JL50_18345 [Peptococcaceae bacterium BICA1-7]|nr:MAG: hypothetical protein JL50_18345 [Peptococcaceae bacterium BICA1-7]
MKKRIAGLLAVILIFVLTAQPVLAAPDEIIGIKVGTQDAYIDNEFKDIYTFNLKEDITVITNNTVDHVIIEGHTVSDYTVSSATYTFIYQDLPFTTKGLNVIDVDAEDSSNNSLGDTSVDVYYSEKDSYYRNENIFKGGSLTAFDSGIKLSLGKDNYYKDSNTEMATSDTSVSIAVEDRYNNDFGSSGDPLEYYSCVSPVFRIDNADSTISDTLSKPVSLTLKIDSGVPPSQYSKLCIVRSASGDFDNDAEIMVGVAKSGTIVSDPFYDLPGYSYAVGMYNRSIDADWAEFSVTPLVAKGLIDEGLVGTLTSNTTRANFAKMVVKGMGVPILARTPSNPVFSDIDDSSTDEEDRCIATAAAYGIMRGDNNGQFNPADPLTRQEAAAVLANVAKLKLVDDQTKVNMGLEKLYSDSGSISSWAGPAVMAVTQAKLMNGSPSTDTEEKRATFNPTSNLNYLESATMVYNLMKKNKRM